MTEQIALKTGWRWRINAKRAAILIGFALTTLGLLGPQIYVTPVEDHIAEASFVNKSLAARIEDMRSWQSQYVLFEQVGALVLALDVAGSAAPGSTERKTLHNLEQMSLVDRTTPILRLIGELAIFHKLSQAERTDRYMALVAAARKDANQDTWRAVSDFENDILRLANERMAELQKIVNDAEVEKTQVEAALAQRKLHLLLMMTFGSTLLLAANLLSEKA